MRISKTRIDRSTTELTGVDRRKTASRHHAASSGTATASAALSVVCLSLLCFSSAYGQEAPLQINQSPENASVQVCPDPPPQTSGSHIFRRLGETFDIPISLADCQPVDLVLRWSNGGNRGSLLSVTFLDSSNQPISSTGISVFLSGVRELPLTPIDSQPWFAAAGVVAVPTTVVIQTVQPFAYPAGISYTVTRKAPRVPSLPRAASQVIAQPAALLKPGSVSSGWPVLDDQVAMKLRTVEGRLITQGQGLWTTGTAGEPVRYKLKELRLPEPRELEIDGRRETIEFAYRLTLAGPESRSSQRVMTAEVPALSKFQFIWIDDAPLPAFSLDSQEISTLIYDRSILRNGARVAVSNTDGSEMYSLTDGLTLPSEIQTPTSNVKANYSNSQVSASNVRASKAGESGNEVVGISSAVRLIGATRIPLVQIELRTSRPFPPRDSVLRLQIGKRFFMNELTGDYSGHTLMLTLTQEMFAELKEGAEIVAFFDKPDRSGFAGRNIWNFGRLNKSLRR